MTAGHLRRSRPDYVLAVCALRDFLSGAPGEAFDRPLFADAETLVPLPT